MISQDEIVANAKTVTKGLEALRTEHETILGGIKASLATVEKEEEGGEGSLIQEKCGLMQRSLDMITLGLGEAHLMGSLATHLQNVEAEKQKLRSQVLKKYWNWSQSIFQVKRLCQENTWLRDELASTQQKLQVLRKEAINQHDLKIYSFTQASEQTSAQLEEDKKHLEFMNSIKK